MIVIPMAGLSRRFFEAGYDRPKYMLPLQGRTLFSHAVGSFAAYYSSHSFMFVARDIAGTADFIESECAALGIAYRVVCLLDAPTAGQAETVEIALNRAAIDDATPLTIFNIDTFRPGFEFPKTAWFGNSAGYLEVFRGEGNNWSYVRPALGDQPRCLETAEKKAISDLCCTGLYHFARAGDFRDALTAERRAPTSPELYVAPLYNHIIAAGGAVHYVIIPREDVVFCGVPAEYESLIGADRHQRDTESATENANSLHDKARAAEHRLDWSTAEGYWLRFLALNDRLWWAHSALAASMHAQGRVKEAHARLLAAQRLLPSEPQIYAEHARLAERDGEWPEALDRWRALQARFPGSWLGYGGEAASLRAMGRLDDADSLLLSVADRFPCDENALHDLARCAERRRDWDNSARLWRKFISLNDRHWWAYTALAASLFELALHDEAEQLLIYASQRFPNEPAVPIALARLYEARLRWNEALPIWDQLTTTHPQLPEVWVGGARVQRLTGAIAEAESKVQVALSRFPHEKTLILEAIAIAEAAGDADNVIGLLNRFCELHPGDAAMQMKRVQVLTNAGMIDQAFLAIKQVLSCGVKNYRVFSQAVALTRASGRIDRLLDHWEPLLACAALDSRGFAADCVDLLISFSASDECQPIIRSLLSQAWDLSTAEMPAAIQATVALRAGPNRVRAWELFVRVYADNKSQIVDKFQADLLEAFIEPGQNTERSGALLSALLEAARSNNWIKDAAIALFSPYFRTNTMLAAFTGVLSRKVLNERELIETPESVLYILLILADVLAEDYYDKLIEATIRSARFADVELGSQDLRSVLARIIARSMKRSAALHPVPVTIRDRRLRMAICVSGQLRGYESAFPTWRSLGIEDHDVTLVVHTWRNIGRNLPDQAVSAIRSFGGQFLKAYQEAIRLRGWNYIRNAYPHLIETVLSEQTVSVDELETFYGAKSVVVEDEGEHRFSDRGNFWKMHYKIYMAHLLGQEYCPEAEVIIRLRPDKLFSSCQAIDWHRVLWESDRHRVIIADKPRMLAPPLWIGDQFAAGVPAVMNVYANTFNVTEAAIASESMVFPRAHFGHVNLAYATFQEGIGVRRFEGLGEEILKNAKLVPPDLILASLRLDCEARGVMGDDEAMLSSAMRDLSAERDAR